MDTGLAGGLRSRFRERSFIAADRKLTSLRRVRKREKGEYNTLICFLNASNDQSGPLTVFDVSCPMSKNLA